MITVRFFRGRLHDLYHCASDCTTLPDCLSAVVPKSAQFGVLEVRSPTDAMLGIVSGAKLAVKWSELNAKLAEQLYAHYRELDIDTTLE